MKKSKKKLVIAISVEAVVLVAILLACLIFFRKSSSKKTAQANEKKTKSKIEKTQVNENSTASVLTGLPVSEEERNARPFAVMIENTKEACPQNGINKAGIIYECPVEGTITRMMAIFQNMGTDEVIGNVRSCRPYYVYFAAEYDAIYAHYGQNGPGKDALNEGIVQDLNGLSGLGNVTYYRTKDRKSPHNAYTTGGKLLDGANKGGYETKYNADEHKHFNFAKSSENTLSDGTTANHIKLYYFYNHPEFTYDASTGLYTRSQFGNPQIDRTDNKPVTVKNIIIENVDYSLVSEKYGTIDLRVVGQGTGKFITNGKAIDITWKKDSNKSVTKYFDASGKEIELNPGKTWICIAQNDYVAKDVIE